MLSFLPSALLAGLLWLGHRLRALTRPEATENKEDSVLQTTAWDEVRNRVREDAFQLGQTVVMHSLRTQPHYNGQQVTICERRGDARLAVTLSAKYNYKILSVKPENLRLVDDAPLHISTAHPKDISAGKQRKHGGFTSPGP
jgi:hypothetical protein